MRDFLGYATVTLSNAARLAETARDITDQALVIAKESPHWNGEINKKRDYALLQIQEARALLKVAQTALRSSSSYPNS